MNTSSHDFVTVDMRGFKAALVARAQAERVSISLMVSSAAAAHPGLSAADDQFTVAQPISNAPVKLSIRLTPAEAQQLVAGARAANLSRGVHVADLIAGVPVRAALIASNAELSTFSRIVHQLTALLKQADVKPAQQYRPMRDTLTGDVRSRRMLASRVLADSQPCR
jgi:hypothetical protein